MNRIEMYNTIKDNGWAEEFKEKYNKNFTQGKNTELEDFINFKSEPKVVPSTNNTKVEEKVKEEIEEETKEDTPEEKTIALEDIDTLSEDVKKETYVSKVAFIELISILQSEACIKDKEAKSVLKLI